MFLALDTETHDIANARMVQIGAVMADKDFNELGALSLLARPEGFTVSEGALATHGLTQEKLVRYGLPTKALLYPLVEMVKVCPYVIIYNSAFDMGVIRREIEAIGSDDRGLDRPGVRIIDTIRIGGSLQDNGRWVKLSILHQQLMGWEYPQAHDGLADARAALRVAQVMLKRKLWEL